MLGLRQCRTYTSIDLRRICVCACDDGLANFNLEQTKLIMLFHHETKHDQSSLWVLHNASVYMYKNLSNFSIVRQVQ